MAVLSSLRFSFAMKAAGALLLVIIAQWLFYGQEPGGTLGVFTLAWCAVLPVAAPALRRGAPAASLAVAAVLALLLVDDPSPLGWALSWTMIASAALLPRRRFDDAFTWLARLATLALIGVVSPARDLAMLSRRSGRVGAAPGALVRLMALPLVGGAMFLALFASANPVLGQALGGIAPPSLGDVILHLFFWAAVLVVVWPTFRPRALSLVGGVIPRGASLDLPVATLAASLAAFNAVFALQNALDLVFLWSAAPLPPGVTLAEYAHQGAYTLIATALIAGAFVLIALAPGSRASHSRVVRRLLLLWIAQNVLLVASSALRLVDYIDAYSLTVLRIAALAWMALVAVGLILVCWRLLAGRSAAWLVNANALTAAATLLAADAVDLGAIAARWNVDRARRAEQLDLCYLGSLGSSALLPLIDLERRAAGPVLRDRARYLRRDIQATLIDAQTDWHQWTWRGARRLAAAQALIGRDVAPLRPAPDGRECDGAIIPPSPPARLTEGSVR